jgi:hypothetical protein
MNGDPRLTATYQLIVLCCNKSNNFLLGLELFPLPEVGTFIPLKWEAVVF